ncbi:MAG TPA: CMD domain protein, partial [Acetobacteraceae bacterium]|nr:CMD domain protein [Acetobacteraceae bacterium]
MSADVIDTLAGIAEDSHLHGLRAQRTQARDNAQASYEALFEPAEPGDMMSKERFAVAVFVAGLHRQPEIAAFYAHSLNAASGGPALRAHVEAEMERGATEGPYGHFPAGPLTAEDTEGPTYRVPDDARATLGDRLAAAMEHAHMLVFHPRDASPAHLQVLLDAGWSATGIVTLSQIVSFLSFQIRVSVT